MTKQQLIKKILSTRPFVRQHKRMREGLSNWTLQELKKLADINN